MRVTFNATAAVPAGSIRLTNTIYEDAHLNMTGGWPEHECITLFRLTSNQIRSLSCTVSSRVSDDSGLRLSKTFITASNNVGIQKITSCLPHGYDVVRDYWCNRVTKPL